MSGDVPLPVSCSGPPADEPPAVAVQAQLDMTGEVAAQLT